MKSIFVYSSSGTFDRWYTLILDLIFFLSKIVSTNFIKFNIEIKSFSFFSFLSYFLFIWTQENLTYLSIIKNQDIILFYFFKFLIVLEENFNLTSVTFFLKEFHFFSYHLFKQRFTHVLFEKLKLSRSWNKNSCLNKYFCSMVNSDETVHHDFIYICVFSSILKLIIWWNIQYNI